MSSAAPVRRFGLMRPALVVLCVVGGVAVWLRDRAPAPTPPYLSAGTAQSPAATPAAREAGPATPSRPSQPAPAAPSFDVVRVGPTGSAVLAGRAAPGTDVVVRDGGQELGRTRADARGEWVLLPGAPLQPGGRELTLSSRDADGREVRAEAPVLLVVPERTPAPSASRPAIADAAPAAPVPPMALLVPPSGAPLLLQGPPAPPDLSGAQSAPGGAARPGTLNMDVVDYTDGGGIRFSGTAPPGAPVRVYVDNAPAGDAMADAQGRWTMTPREAVATGVHRLRVDQITRQGRVQARVELPFQRAVLPEGAVPEGRVVVQPGQSLWRLAHRAYGTGFRYTVIYQANREQIRDPNRIYPGQTFDVPGL